MPSPIGLDTLQNFIDLDITENSLIQKALQELCNMWSGKLILTGDIPYDYAASLTLNGYRYRIGKFYLQQDFREPIYEPMYTLNFAVSVADRSFIRDFTVLYGVSHVGGDLHENALELAYQITKVIYKLDWKMYEQKDTSILRKARKWQRLQLSTTNYDKRFQKDFFRRPTEMYRF